MKREIRQLTSTADYRSLANIQLNAYPTIERSPEELIEGFESVRDASALWGLWEEGTLIGGMRLLDFSMNYCGRFIPAGGIGSLAVDLIHKRKGAARELVEFFLDRCDELEQTVALLYPFRPDFYYRLGFGYGTKMHHYRFEPSSLPVPTSRGGIVYLTEQDREAISQCYRTFAANTHGYCKKTAHELDQFVSKYCPGRAVGYWNGETLEGYLAFDFERAHESSFLKNNLVIREWIANTRAASAALCGFLYRQTDQINRIVHNTQDENFHHLLRDVRNGTDNVIPHVYHESNTSGVGLMYRIVSMEKFLQKQQAKTTGRLTLEVRDGFRRDNTGNYHVEFGQHRVTLLDEAPQAPIISGDIADLSALLMGSVDVETLFRFNKLDCSAEALELAAELLNVETKPQCITPF
jgi:predicted acetyltransferase